MTFDPFNDFETRGYLQNVFGEKDLEIVKNLENSAFIAGIAEAFQYLSSVRQLSYRDVLRTHQTRCGSHCSCNGKLELTPGMLVLAN